MAELTSEKSEERVVIGIGASAGGLQAFTQFFQHLPPDTGMSFVLIQHLDPDHDSKMAELLGRQTSMSVVEVREALDLEPNKVYLIPPDTYLGIEDGKLVPTKPTQERGLRMPIDFFFRSLAENFGKRCACIILSGTGSDGTQGMKEVMATGGLTIVQDPESAEHDGMPCSAIADLTLPIAEMPEVLSRFANHDYVKGDEKSHSPHVTSPDHFKSILSHVHAKTGYDFRCYKKGTLNRRIQRRMGLRQMDLSADYLEFLRKDAEEVNALFDDLLIGVTRFFRDPDVWEYLVENVIRPLIMHKESGSTLRVWVAGCSTGEEAYTIAILLCEEIGRQNKSLTLQLFATDLDQHAVSVARAGIYPANVSLDIDADRLENFFTVEGDRFRVNKNLRESCIFAAQNIVSDPPFSNLDLVSCRNLLIYLETSIQEKLTQLFHFALAQEGVLLLGSSESTTKGEGYFEPISKSLRIFRKKKPNCAKKIVYPVMARPMSLRAISAPRHIDPREGAGVGTVEFVRKILLDSYAPASILIDTDHTIHYFHGPLGPYLNTPSGQPSSRLFANLIGSLEIKVRGLIRQAENEKKTTSAVTAPIRHGDKTCAIRLTVEPLEQGPDSLLFLITFQDLGREYIQSGKGPEEVLADLSLEEANLLRQMEYELQATREDLQSSIEELETSNEELKASNEEVMSMNEELQSLNEELSTVNGQLGDKVEELESSSNDLTNFIASTEIATIFLDADLRIRRFTPPCRRLLNIVPGDEGRPISDLSPRVNDESLLDDARLVIDNLEPSEKEVRASDGSWYFRRILPFRTSENKISGVVITFTDINAIKRTYRDLENREQQQAAVARLGQIALKIRAQEELFEEVAKALVKELNVEFSKILRFDRENQHFVMASGVGWEGDLIGDGIVSAGLDSHSGYTWQIKGPVILEDLAKEKRFNTSQLLKNHGVKSGMTIVIGSPDDPWGVLGIHSANEQTFSVDDVNFFRAVAHILSEATRRESVIDQLEESQSRLKIAYEAANLGTHDYDVIADKVLWDERSYELWGLDPASEVTYATFIHGVHENDREVLQSKVDELFNIDGDQIFSHEFRVVNRKDGRTRWIAATARAFFHEGKAIRAVGTYQNITEMRELIEQQSHWAEHLEEQVIERTALAEKRSADLRQLATQITNAEERTRRKVAQIIHDDVQQLLIAAKMRLPMGADERASPAELQLVSDLLDKTLSQARSLVSELSPPVLQDGGFDKALVWLAAHMESTHHLKVALDLEGDLQSLEESLGILLFNVVRELLFNAVKHSGVDEVDLSTSTKDEMLVVVVEDSGKGFDVAARRKDGDGFGLFSIEERLNAFGGSMEIVSIPGDGALFCLTVPVRRRKARLIDFEESAGDEAHPVEGPRVRRREKIRILIADDHKIVREGFARVLASVTDFEIVAMADNGDEAIRLALEHRPDLILMDISMPKINGIEATKEIKARRKDTVIIGLSLHEEDVLGKAMRQAGASAYLEKDVAGSQLIKIIREFFPNMESGKDE